MLARKTILARVCSLLFMASLALSACTKPPAEEIIEAPPPPQTSEASSAPPQPNETAELPPPKLEEIQAAVKRVFKDAVVIDAGRQPSFLVGDFNGDLSQDLAVVLKPADGMLSELNQEFPNWIAREPLEEVLPKSKVVAQPAAAKPLPNPASGQTVRFEKYDVLLAIIHGYGKKGWHDSEATQTHLLRGVVGTNMRILPEKEVVKTYRRIRPFPSIYGDLIQQTLIGQSGFIHFAGGFYGWYDPKNYKHVPGVMSPHSGASAMR